MSSMANAAVKEAVNSRKKDSEPGRRNTSAQSLSIMYVVITLLPAWALLSWVKSVPDTLLQFMLYPHKLAAEIFYHTSFHYFDGIGYLASNSAYAIGRECMGYNFILLLYAMNACTYVRHFAGISKLLWLAASFTDAVIIGTFVSILRILGSIPFSSHPNFHLIHLAMGVTMYLFVLAADYGILNKLFGRIHHED